MEVRFFFDLYILLSIIPADKYVQYGILLDIYPEGEMAVLRRIILGVTIILFVSGLFGITQRLDRWITDTHWRVCAFFRPVKFNKNILIIAIDDKTIRKYGKLRYWSRSRYAELIRNLSKARAICLDILLTEPDYRDIKGDMELASAIRINGRVILPCYEWTGPPPVTNDIIISQEKLLSTLPTLSVDDINKVNPLLIELPIPALFNPDRVGYSDIESDPDGVYRTPVLAKQTYDNRPLLHVSLALASLASGTPGMDVIKPGFFQINGRKIQYQNGSILLEPIARRGGSYYIGTGSSVPTVSFVDAVSMSSDKFRDKIILIGETTTGTPDIKPNPFDSGLRGVELNAEIVQNLLYMKPVGMLPVIYAWLTAIVGCLLPVYIYRMFRPATANLYAFTALVLSIFAMELVFWGARLVPSWSIVILAFVSSTLLTAMQKYTSEETIKRHIRQNFAMYVAPELVEEIVNNPSIAHQEGTRREVAVLFSDIRGFTPYCEKHSPEFVVKQMREYLGEMTFSVEDHGGVLDKYMGDAVMALFGPFMPDHINKSAAAVSCAIDMQHRLNHLNETWKENGFPELKCGIGIHVGDAIVGNFGAEKRMQYTALGDTVNLAARLESTTKELKVDVLISDVVRSQIGDHFAGQIEFVNKGEIVLKGREHSVEVFEIREFLT